MHPALIRYVETPSPRFLRNFVFGAAIGVAALIGVLAVAEIVGTEPSVRVLVRGMDAPVFVSAGPERSPSSTEAWAVKTGARRRRASFTIPRCACCSPPTPQARASTSSART